MSDVRNKANSLNLGFPIPGVNNSSQGFRDNTAATQQALFTAGDEIDKIQRTRFTFSGDAVGQSDRITNAVVLGSADPTLEVPFTLANVLTTGALLNTNTSDFTLTFDAKGRLIATTPVQHSITWDAGHGENVTVGITGTSMGTGTGAITFPTFRFDPRGRLIQTTTQTINYGLQDQTLSYGAILVGGNTNISRELSPPSGDGAYALVANGPQLSWQTVGAGTVSGIVGGLGITVTGDSEAPVVSLDLSDLTASPDIQDTDELIYLDASENVGKRLTLGQIRPKIVKVIVDETPQLGGDLDVGLFKIMTTGNQGVVIHSLQATPKSTLSVTESGIALQGSEGTALTLQAPSTALTSDTLTLDTKTTTLDAETSLAVTSPDISVTSAALKLNNILWPTVAGTNGQFLVMGPSGLTWVTPSISQQTIEKTLFVTPTGQDTNTGAFNSPLQTIQRAVNLIPSNSDDLWTIVVMGGIYTQAVNIEGKKKVALEGLFSAGRARITNALTVSYGVDEFYMNNLIWDGTTIPNDVPQPVLLLLNGLVRGLIRDCEFLRGSEDSVALALNGQTTGPIEMLDCRIVGTVENSMDLSEEGELIIESIRSKLDKNLPVELENQERDLNRDDVGKYLRVSISQDNQFGVPENSQGKFKVGATIRLTQIGTGRTSVRPLGNVTINTPNGYRLRQRFSSATLTYVGNDIWDLYGDLDLDVINQPTTRVDTDGVTVDTNLISVDNG